MESHVSSLREKLLVETSRCSFCGFCEWVCPTLQANRMLRSYGPRGRVNMIAFALREGLWSMEGLKGIYTCLLCATCNTQCPAQIDIAGIVRAFRYYLRRNSFNIPRSITTKELVTT